MSRCQTCSLFAFLLMAMMSTGCASILAGKTQTITLNTSPSGARCELVREGRVIGTVENTPGAVTLNKTKHDIDVICRKEGFSEAKGFAESGTEGATFGNILLGGVIGWAVDSAAGADNKYPDVVTVNLAPMNAPPQPTQPAIAPAISAGKSDKRRGSTDFEKRLALLKKMKEEGVLTEEEYQKKRAEVVDKL